jgi:hypothetical protein
VELGLEGYVVGGVYKTLWEKKKRRLSTYVCVRVVVVAVAVWEELPGLAH